MASPKPHCPITGKPGDRGQYTKLADLSRGNDAAREPEEIRHTKCRSWTFAHPLIGANRVGAKGT